MNYTRPVMVEKDTPCAVCNKTILCGEKVTQTSRNKWFINTIVVCSDQCIRKEEERSYKASRSLDRAIYTGGAWFLSYSVLTLSIRFSDKCSEVLDHGCNKFWVGDWVSLLFVILAVATATTRFQQKQRKMGA